MKKTIAETSKTKSRFSEKIKKKTLINPKPDSSRKKRERIQINKIRNEKGDVAMNTTGVQRIISNYYEQLYVNKMDNLEEMEKFSERYNLLGLNHEEIENMNRPITSTEMETVINNLPTESRTRWLHRRILLNI